MASSRSPSPVSPPAYWSDSSDDFAQCTDIGEAEGSLSHSRPGSPESTADTEDVATCRWADCGRVFNHLPTLIEHIHTDHIGMNKTNYTCEWSTCSRRGLPQTSRFALISHLRSHTGEKPYVCTRPECDKSFTRSDALAKHLRLQHNIIMPPASRGGSRNRKRKRDMADDGLYPEGSLSSFRVDENYDAFPVGGANMHHDSRSESLSPPPSPQSPFIPPASVFGPQPGFVFMDPPEVEVIEDEENDPYIPQHLLQAMSPETGLIYGRTPAMVAYILQKAKYQMALQKHEDLLEDLKTWRGILEIQREEKDKVLDMVLAAEMGAEASKLVRKIHGPHWRPRLDDGDPPKMIPLPARYDVDTATPTPVPTTKPNMTPSAPAPIPGPPPPPPSLPPPPPVHHSPIDIAIIQDPQRPMNLAFDSHTQQQQHVTPREMGHEPLSSFAPAGRRPQNWISMDRIISMNGTGEPKRSTKRRRS